MGKLIEILNSTLVQNLEQGELPTVHVQVEITKDTLIEIGITLMVVVLFACVVTDMFNRKRSK